MTWEKILLCRSSGLNICGLLISIFLHLVGLLCVRLAFIPGPNLTISQKVGLMISKFVRKFRFHLRKEEEHKFFGAGVKLYCETNLRVSGADLDADFQV